MLKGVCQVKGALDLREEQKAAVGKPKAGRDILSRSWSSKGAGAARNTVSASVCVQRAQVGARGGAHTPGGGQAAP